MKKALNAVEEFHTAFRVPVRQQPTLTEPSEWKLRHRILQEENDEYAEACDKGDLVGIADALGDQLYVLCGTILTHGMQHVIEEVLMEIHRSNLSKLDENGAPVYREDGKVLKGAGYFPPDLKQFLDIQS